MKLIFLMMLFVSCNVINKHFGKKKDIPTPSPTTALPAQIQSIGPAGQGLYYAGMYSLIPASTDQSAKFNSTIAAIPDGATLILNRGSVYNISASIIIAHPITIDGNGAIINYTSPGTPSSFGIEIRSSGVTIKNLEIKSTYASYVGLGALISTNLNSNSNIYSNINIDNCTVHGYTGSGIMMRWVKDISITNCKIDSVPYAGIALYSVVRGNVSDNRIADITAVGTTGSNAYGITISQSFGDSISKDVSVERNYVYRVPWEGIDTHGGEALVIDGNFVYDCGVGIAMVGTTNRGPNNVRITNNTVRSYDFGEAAISIAGGVGGSDYYAHVIIQGNVCTGQHIRLAYTKGCQVIGNFVESSGTTYGIYVSGDNVDASILSNTFKDIYSPGGSNVYAIFFDNNNNTGYVHGNTIVATTTVLTNKNKYGFATAASSTGCIATIGMNDFSAATVPYRYGATSAASGQHSSKFTTLDGTRTTTLLNAATYDVVQEDKLIIYQYNTSGVTINLPAIAALQDKREIIIVNASTQTVTTNISMYTTTAASSTIIAAGTKARLTYDMVASKIWRD